MFGLSAAIVLLLVIAHFRSWRALVAFGTLAAGFLGLLAIMDAFDLELTTFNLVVLPSMVGIGIDSFVFLTHRHAQTGDIAATLRETGVATVLTALTTAAGFGSATAAQHPGVQSVGPLSLIALACLLVSALVLLPSALALLPRAKRRTDDVVVVEGAPAD
jgi:predicted RND superfamily exporter protein